MLMLVFFVPGAVLCVSMLIWCGGWDSGCNVVGVRLQVPSEVLLGRSRRLTVLLFFCCGLLLVGGCGLKSGSSPKSIKDTVLQALTLLSLLLQERLPGAAGQIVAAATAAYSLSGVDPPLEPPKMLPLKACDGRQAVLMVALLSGCQADSSCLAMINQVRKMTLIRDVLILESNVVEVPLKALKAKNNSRLSPSFPEIFVQAEKGRYVGFGEID